MNKVHLLPKFLCVIFYYSFLRYLPASYIPVFGKMSKYLRYQCCKVIFKKCGLNVNIERMAFFGSGFKIEIGNNSGIGVKCTVPSDTIIGDDVLMGRNLYIFSHNHNYIDSNKLIRLQKHQQKKQTVIGNDIWIGSNCTFTPGRKIRNGIVIGTCSVVTKDFDEYSVIGGNPAVLIKKRISLDQVGS